MNNKVIGKIVEDGSGRGIPDLLVAVFDVDPKITNETLSAGFPNQII